MGEIEDIVAEIARVFQPEQIILFGSYAYGKPRSDSDVDLLIIMPFEGSPSYKALEILAHVDPSFAVDLLVRSPDEIEQRLAWHDFFLGEIIEQGKVLYAAPYARVG